jgi:hypothetical protein
LLVILLQFHHNMQNSTAVRCCKQRNFDAHFSGWILCQGMQFKSNFKLNCSNSWEWRPHRVNRNMWVSGKLCLPASVLSCNWIRKHFYRQKMLVGYDLLAIFQNFRRICGTLGHFMPRSHKAENRKKYSSMGKSRFHTRTELINNVLPNLASKHRKKWSSFFRSAVRWRAIIELLLIFNFLAQTLAHEKLLAVHQ